MKLWKLLLPLSLLPLPIGVQAAPPAEILCHSTNVADAGFEFSLAANRKAAKLDMQTIAGPRPLATLACAPIRPGPVHPDELVNTLVCRSQPIGQGGYVVRLYEGGILFHREARVLQARDNQGHEVEVLQQFGQLICPARE